MPSGRFGLSGSCSCFRSRLQCLQKIASSWISSAQKGHFLVLTGPPPIRAVHRKECNAPMISQHHTLRQSYSQQRDATNPFCSSKPLYFLWRTRTEQSELWFQIHPPHTSPSLKSTGKHAMQNNRQLFHSNRSNSYQLSR